MEEKMVKLSDVSFGRTYVGGKLTVQALVQLVWHVPMSVVNYLLTSHFAIFHLGLACTYVGGKPIATTSIARRQ